MDDSPTKHTLSEFAQNAGEHCTRLRATGQPEVLTVEGQSPLVVQDAEAYERMLAAKELVDSVSRIHQALGELDAGDSGMDMRQFLESLAARAGAPLNRAAS